MQDATGYLQKCMNDCTSRIAEECFFQENDLQRSALRLESLRDMSPRCGEKMPEHWHEDVKNVDGVYGFFLVVQLRSWNIVTGKQIGRAHV